MKRREFVAKLGLAALAGGSMTACQKEKTAEVQQKLSQEPVRHWKMVTTWPKNFPILGSGAERLAELITSMSNGKLVVKVYAAGELVPAFECFDVVSQGAAQMGHSAPYYWQGKEPVLQFFGGIPFGMSALQMDAWFYHGEGLKLWEEAYAPFGLIPMPAGNTGVQMGGWFNREINKIEDFKGLKMRMPGLGGEILRRIGAAPVLLPGGELLIGMQTGVIDAVEWASPYLDLVFGLDKVAKYYYYPGWQECGTTLECMVNRDAMEELPDYLRQIIRVAAQSTNVVMRSEYVAKSSQALIEIEKAGDIDLRRFPDEVLDRLREVSLEVVETLAASSEFAGRIYRSHSQFQQQTKKFLNISEKIMADLSF